MDHSSLSSPAPSSPPLGKRQRLRAYLQLMRLDKPIGILLLLWPTLWGLWFAAGGWPPLEIVMIFVLGTVLMRSAGCVVNDYADRHFDPYVERTKLRPLASGALTTREALLLAGLLMAVAFALVLRLNGLTIALAVVAAVVAVIYPFMKRIFPLPQAWLGLAFGFGIPMAFAAVTQAVPPVAGWLLLATMFWAIAYDTEYAMVDREDDLRIGIHSAAILFGRYDVLAVMLAHGVFLGLMVAIGVWHQRGLAYAIGCVLALGLIGYQYRLIAQRSRAGCFQAFLNNHWIGCVLFCGLALDLWLNR